MMGHDEKTHVLWGWAEFVREHEDSSNNTLYEITI